MAGTRSTAYIERRRPVDVHFLTAATRIVEAREARSFAAPPRRERSSADGVAATFAVALLLLALVGVGVARAGPGCPRVAYVVDSTGAPVEIRGAAATAFARFAAATGVEVAVADRATPKQVVIAWGPGEGFARSGGSVAAGHTAPGAEALTGLISLNADYDLPVDSAERPSWTSVLMHELGHIAGLTHSSARTELMYPTIGRPATWGAEDLARLRAAGERWGCLTPSP